MADTLLEKINKIKSMETPIVEEGFKSPSVYKGKSLEDTTKAFQTKTGTPAHEYLMNRGRPLIGKTGGEKSLELINKVVDPVDRFEKIGGGLREAEEIVTGTSIKSMKNKPIRRGISEFFESVQSKADDVFGAAQDIAGDIAKQEDKLKFITKEIAEKFPSVAAKGIDFVKRIGFAMLFGGPSMIGADLIPEPIMKDMMRDLGMTQEVPEAAKGGMMNINDITRPVGV